MIIDIHDIGADGARTFRSRCDLRECYPDDDLAYDAARAVLQADGRYWEGGGASPLTLLVRVEIAERAAS